MLKKYDELLILEPIKQYFSTYYENIKTGQYRDVSRWFILNDDTVIPQRMLQNKFKLYNAFNLWIKKYQLDLEFEDVQLLKDHARVVVRENVEYTYQYDEAIKTKMSGVEYEIMLKKIDGAWKIIYMDSDNELYLSAKQNSEGLKVLNKKSQLSPKGEALNYMFDELDKEVHSLIILSNNQQIEYFITEENDTQSLVNPFAYIPSNGVLYAREYADFKKVPEDNRLFYYAENGSDCANFVSQCVWAAYGGYMHSEIEMMKKNISQKVRMVKTGNQSTSWYGTGTDGGGTPYWENVNNFYKYITTSKEIGPRGKGYGGCIQTEFNFSEVKVGDVLQFWKPSQNKWYHSTYVSSIGPKGQIDQIHVCQHSIDIIDRPLVDLLAWNTNEGKLRGIHFTDATFSQ